MSSSLRPPSWLVHLLILTAVALPYCLNLGTSSLWDSNEAFYAETPREMLLTGDYLAPQFNFQPRAQKPPLTYWAVLLSYKLVGVHEYSVRLPGALAAIGVLFFTYGIARSSFGPRAALVAAVILGTTARIFILARRLPIDILLLFWLLGTAFFLVRAIRTESRGNWALVYLFVGLGLLTKGPIAFIVPAASHLIWSLRARRFRLSALHPWMGMLIMIAVATPWYVLIYAAHGWTYIATFFLNDNLGRFTSQDFGPARNFLYYVPTYLADFFPWSFLTPLTLYYLWKNRASEGGLGRLSSGFPLVWCGFIFLFFSLSRNKQEYYIAAIYPMMAVLIAGVLDRTTNSRESERPPLLYFWRWTYFAVSAALLALSVLLLFVSHAVLPEVPLQLHLVPVIILFVTFVTLAWNIVRGKLSRCFAGLAGPLWILFVCFTVLYLPAVERYRPVKELCRVIASRSGTEDEAGYFRATAPSMVYYLRRPIFEEYDADAMVRRFQSPRQVFCLLTERDYDYFVGSRDMILYVLDRRPRLVTRLRDLLNQSDVADQELLLVSNKP